MGVHERRERERLETRGKILDAARELFVRHGYEAVSMRKIADAIEYSPTAIYVHFKDKRALMTELCRCDFGALSAGAMGIAGEADPVARIRRLGKMYIRFAVEHPNHYRLMFMTPLPDGELPLDEEDFKRKDDPTQNGYALLRAAVAEALAGGRFPGAGGRSVELLTQTFWAGVHGVASLQIAKGNDGWVAWTPLEDRVDAMVETLLAGVGATATGAKPKSVTKRARPGKAGGR